MSSYNTLTLSSASEAGGSTHQSIFTSTSRTNDKPNSFGKTRAQRAAQKVSHLFSHLLVTNYASMASLSAYTSLGTFHLTLLIYIQIEVRRLLEGG